MKSRGFTLIELLVVIAIIGLLATMAVVAFSGAQRKARDAKRLADVRQIRKALELYYDDNGLYPDACNPDTSCRTTSLNAYLSSYINVPLDPINSGIYIYGYARQSTYPNDYAIHVRLEDGTDCKTGVNVHTGWWGSGIPLCDF